MPPKYRWTSLFFSSYSQSSWGESSVSFWNTKVPEHVTWILCACCCHYSRLSSRDANWMHGHESYYRGSYVRWLHYEFFLCQYWTCLYRQILCSTRIVLAKKHTLRGERFIVRVCARTCVYTRRLSPSWESCGLRSSSLLNGRTEQNGLKYFTALSVSTTGVGKLRTAGWIRPAGYCENSYVIYIYLICIIVL